MKNIVENIDLSHPDPSEYKSLFALWARNYQTRRALNGMERHRLLDIGIDRAQANHESRKPFWR